MSKGPLQHLLYPIAQFVRNPAYRQFVYFLARYRGVERYKEHRLRFQHYTVRVADVPSFIFQYKDIFVEEQYRFSAQTQSPIIIDCGANIGISCLYFKHLFPDAVITAIEPDTHIVSILKENLETNGISNVSIIAKAAWKDNAGVEFSEEGADGGSIYGEQQNKIKIPSVRLAEILAQHERIHFLKMDIEGAEVEVIADCVNELARVEQLYIEYHAWKHLPQQFDIMLSKLTQSGFRYYIQSVSEQESPLYHPNKTLMNDLQLHVFAVRLDGNRV